METATEHDSQQANALDRLTRLQALTAALGSGDLVELFVQVDHASTRSQGGLGIGLTLVKNLAEMHHGTVEAHRGGLGQGSEFVVWLTVRSVDRTGVLPSCWSPAVGYRPAKTFAP